MESETTTTMQKGHKRFHWKIFSTEIFSKRLQFPFNRCLIIHNLGRYTMQNKIVIRLEYVRIDNYTYLSDCWLIIFIIEMIPW